MSAVPGSTRGIARRLREFVAQVPGVIDAVVVSPEGLPIAASKGLHRDAVDRFSAVTIGLVALTDGAAGRFGGGAVKEIIIELENVFLFVTRTGIDSSVAVIAEHDADVGLIGYEVAGLSLRLDSLLPPALGPDEIHDLRTERRAGQGQPEGANR